MPSSVIFGAIIRGDEIIMPDENLELSERDHVIILALREKARQVEKMFSVNVDLF